MTCVTFGRLGVQVSVAGPDYPDRYTVWFVGHSNFRSIPVYFSLRFTYYLTLNNPIS